MEKTGEFNVAHSCMLHQGKWVGHSSAFPQIHHIILMHTSVMPLNQAIAYSNRLRRIRVWMDIFCKPRGTAVATNSEMSSFHLLLHSSFIHYKINS
jgi:hypothetical protein